MKLDLTLWEIYSKWMCVCMYVYIYIYATTMYIPVARANLSFSKM